VRIVHNSPQSCGQAPERIPATPDGTIADFSALPAMLDQPWIARVARPAPKSRRWRHGDHDMATVAPGTACRHGGQDTGWTPACRMSILNCNVEAWPPQS
jgi:hypothetical protein